MTWKTRTLIFCGAIILAIIAWDIVVTLTPEQDDTISEQFQIIARAFPFLAFAWGVVSAHLVLTRRWRGHKVERFRYWALLAACVVAAVLAWTVGGLPGVYGAAGVAVGYLWFPQYTENFPKGGQGD